MGLDIDTIVVTVNGTVGAVSMEVAPVKTVRERKLEEDNAKLRKGFELIMDAIRSDVNNAALVGTIYMDVPEEWTVLDYCEHMSLLGD